MYELKPIESAANAPEVPDWYRLKMEAENEFDGKAFFDKHCPQGMQVSREAESLFLSEIFNHKESLRIKIYFSWRRYYAEHMISVLSVQDVGDSAEGRDLS